MARSSLGAHLEMMATVVRAVMPGSSISRVIKGIEAADKGV